MGYTHYWYTQPELSKEKWQPFISDCRKIVDYCQNELGIAISGGLGTGKPELSVRQIWLNGSDSQPLGVWTTSDHVSIPWPSPTAGLTEMISDPIGEKTAGNWFAGTLLQQRTAPIENGHGAGSYETFGIERINTRGQNKFSQPDEKEYGKCFACCKTAYRPYDLTVTAILIALKHHFGDDVVIHSDGTSKDWMDGRILCNNLLGYGLTTPLDFD